MRHSGRATPRRPHGIARIARCLLATGLTLSGACRDHVTAPDAAGARPATPRAALTVGALVTPVALPMAGATSGAAVDINDSGVVLGTITKAGTRTLVRWLPSGVMDTVPVGGPVLRIANDGRVAGMAGGAAVWNPSTGGLTRFPAPELRSMSPDGRYAVILLPVAISHTCLDRGISTLVGLTVQVWENMSCAPGWGPALPMDVNDSGTVVGIFWGATSTQAFLWRRFVDRPSIRLLGSPPSSAYAVNDAGVIVGQQGGQAVRFLVEPGNPVVVLAPELGSSTAVAVNDKGDVVINTATGAWLLRGATLIPLATLGGCCARAQAVNEQSQVVGYATTASGEERPVRWNAAASPVMAQINGPYSALEGAPIEFLGTAFGVTPPVARAWSFGDGATGEGGRVMHAYADDGTYAVVFTVTSGDGWTATATSMATIANVAPTVVGGPGANIESGDTFVLRARFDDPGVLDGPWSWEVRDGAGTLATGSLASAPDSIIAPVVLRTAGAHALTLGVTDADGGVGTASVVVTVRRLAVPLRVHPANPTALARGKGLLTVVVEATDRVRVEDIDVATVRLADLAPATRGRGVPMAALEDVDGDGALELVLKFEREALPRLTTLVLQADLRDGRQVEGRWAP